MPANNTSNLAAILEGQAKMQHELADLKKCSANEMEVLRQENSRLRRKIDADPTQKGKGKELLEAPRSPAYQPSEEESEYTIPPHTLSLPLNKHPSSPHHTATHHPTTIPAQPTTNHPAATLPTTHIPSHHYSTTFPTIVQHPIPPHPSKRRHPFIDTITTTPLPSQWEPFTLDHYAGETDPDEHLKVYIPHVSLYTSNDIVFYKAFPTTLKDPTLKWFTTLPHTN